jgi:uncharacterized protein involved in type VI secretion and phage assembly
MLPTELIHVFARRFREAEEHADRIYEPVIGVVTDNKDPDKLSRVKVNFPFLPGTDTSHWAPVVSLGAGKERGWYFLPEVDDEVVVMFAHGCIRRPVVLGAVWNGQDAPPDSNDGANERRVIHSREGSRIEFDDDAGTVVLEDGGGIGKITMTTENKITIEATSGDVCIQAPDGELNVVCKELKATGSMNLHVTGGSSGVVIGGDGKVTLKGGSMIKVAGAQVSLKASAGAPGEASASPEEVPDPLG